MGAPSLVEQKTLRQLLGDSRAVDGKRLPSLLIRRQAPDIASEISHLVPLDVSLSLASGNGSGGLLSARVSFGSESGSLGSERVPLGHGRVSVEGDSLEVLEVDGRVDISNDILRKCFVKLGIQMVDEGDTLLLGADLTNRH